MHMPSANYNIEPAINLVVHIVTFMSQGDLWSHLQAYDNMNTNVRKVLETIDIERADSVPKQAARLFAYNSHVYGV